MSSTFWWSDEAVALLVDRYRIDGPKKLAEQLGTTRFSVTFKARRLGIEPTRRNARPHDWTKQALGKLRALYPTAGRQELVEKLGVPWHVIQRKVRALGLRNTTRAQRSGATRAASNRSCDIHYFDSWSPDMAYVLGFLFADGSITKRKSEVVIGVAASDEVVLRFIKKSTQCQRDIYVRDAYVDRQGYRHQKSVFLTIGSTLLVRRLMQLGLQPRKTYRNDPLPKMPRSALPHFVRGYFDGDGTAYVVKDKRWPDSSTCRLGFVGPPQLVADIRNSLARHAGMSRQKTCLEKHQSTTTGRVIWTTPDDLKKFHAFVYPEGFSFCLQRKKAVLDHWLETKVT